MGFQSSSPRRSEGRPLERTVLVTLKRFQSTPPAEARGDGRILRRGDVSQMGFQSTPPAEARGDGLGSAASWKCCHEVSIHSPRRSEGRPALPLREAVDTSRFNPLPPPKRGETTRTRPACAISIRGFNPLPPPKRGETWRTRRECQHVWKVSIHSPRRSEGRPLPRPRILLSIKVSIHSPRRSEGRLGQVRQW